MEIFAVKLADLAEAARGARCRSGDIDGTVGLADHGVACAGSGRVQVERAIPVLARALRLHHSARPPPAGHLGAVLARPQLLAPPAPPPPPHACAPTSPPPRPPPP